MSYSNLHHQLWAWIVPFPCAPSLWSVLSFHWNVCCLLRHNEVPMRHLFPSKSFWHPLWFNLMPSMRWKASEEIALCLQSRSWTIVIDGRQGFHDARFSQCWTVSWVLHIIINSWRHGNNSIVVVYAWRPKSAELMAWHAFWYPIRHKVTIIPIITYISDHCDCNLNLWTHITFSFHASPWSLLWLEHRNACWIR